MTPQQQDLIDSLNALAESGRSSSDVREVATRAATALSNAYHEIDSLNRVIVSFDHVTKALADKNATIDRLQGEIDDLVVRLDEQDED